MSEDSLSFRRPATRWTDALPLGNGITGAMVFGAPRTERIQINDGRAWSGSPRGEFAEPQLTGSVAQAALAEARDAVGRRDYVGATAALKRLQHRHTQSYLPFADLWLSVATKTAEDSVDNSVDDYVRRLDLETATHETRYVLDGSLVVQTTFVSHADGVLVHQVRFDHRDGVDLELWLGSDLRVTRVDANLPGEAGLELAMPSDVSPAHDDPEIPILYSSDDTRASVGAVAVKWVHDGRQEPATSSSDSATLRASGVRLATLYLSTETSFAGAGKSPSGSAAEVHERAACRVAAAADSGRDALYERHRRDHASLYSRVRFAVGTGTGNEQPADLRLVAANRHPGGALAADPGLAVLLFNYGRYLLISSSRPGGAPANLQGIWNDSIQPPWSSNYTTNINLEMNYWSAEVANLPEVLPPLFDLIEALAVTGAATAKRLYGAQGWVAHHNTDIWAYSLPVGGGRHDPKWAFWPFAGAWLVRHLWEHISFGADIDFVRDRAWGPIRGVAEFMLDWLIQGPDGSLATSPSTSPENEFDTPAGPASVGESATLDMTLIGDVFDMIATLAPLVGASDDPVVLRAAHARQKLPEISIGSDGLVEEWPGMHKSPEPNHRHQSHLYFLFPGDRQLSPALAAAASHSLDARGDESTGWSLAWKLALRARLHQPARVSALLRLFFRTMDADRGTMSGGLYRNLFAAHPPFQIDGNLGFVAAIAESLLQSHAGEIELLPSVPAELGRGSISGLVGRPGIEVSLAWESDESGRVRLRHAELRARTARAAGTHRVRYGRAVISVAVGTDHAIRLTPEQFASSADSSTQGDS